MTMFLMCDNIQNASLKRQIMQVDITLFAESDCFAKFDTQLHCRKISDLHLHNALFQ